jgi:hypothetical protein
MQKVVGSSPIIRSLRNPVETAGFFMPIESRVVGVGSCVEQD